MAEPSRAQPTIDGRKTVAGLEPDALKTGASIAMVYYKEVAM
jgi:hypothetical protein